MKLYIVLLFEKRTRSRILYFADVL